MAQPCDFKISIFSYTPNITKFRLESPLFFKLIFDRNLWINFFWVSLFLCKFLKIIENIQTEASVVALPKF